MPTAEAWWMRKILRCGRARCWNCCRMPRDAFAWAQPRVRAYCVPIRRRRWRKRTCRCTGSWPMHAEPHVLHLHSGAGLYGAEYVLLGLIPALAQQGIDGSLLCLDNHLLDEQPLYQRACALKIPSQRLPCRGRFDFATLRALRRVLGQHPNAMLHVHGYKSAFYAWLARRAGEPSIVATLHGHFADTPSMRIYQALELWLMRGFDRVCMVAAEMQPMLARAGVAGQNISLIENGVDTTRFRPDVAPLERADCGIPEDAFVFGSAMRLSEQKHPLGLLDASA